MVMEGGGVKGQFVVTLLMRHGGGSLTSLTRRNADIYHPNVRAHTHTQTHTNMHVRTHTHRHIHAQTHTPALSHTHTCYVRVSGKEEEREPQDE